MPIIPVSLTIRLLGIAFTLIIPSNKVFIFFYGVLFWAIMGPAVKWLCREIIRNIGAILGGHYVKKDEYAGHERSPAYSHKYSS